MPITPHIRIAGTAPNTSILDPTGLVYSVYPPHILTVDCSETVSDYWGADSWRRLQFTIDFGDAGSPWMPGLASDFWFSGRSRRYAYERIGTHAYTQRPAPGQTLTYTIRVTVSDVLHPEDTVESSFDLRVLELPFPDAAGDYIYVDPINGSDSYNGNHKTPISGLQGPKRSLANALSVFRATGRRYLVIVGNAVTLPITPSAWPTSVADAALRMIVPLTDGATYTIAADASGDLVRASNWSGIKIQGASLLGFNGGSVAVLPCPQTLLVGCDITNWSYGVSQSGVRRDDVALADCHLHGIATYDVFLGDAASGPIKQRCSLDGCVLETVTGEHSFRGALHKSVIQHTRIVGRNVGKVTLKYDGRPAADGGSQDGVISGCDLVGEADVPGGTVVCAALTNTGSGNPEEIHRTSIGHCLIRTPELTGATRGIELKLAGGTHIHDSVLHGWSEAVERGGADGAQGITGVVARNLVHFTARATNNDVFMFSTGSGETLQWGLGNLDARNCYQIAPNATGRVAFIAGGDTVPGNVIAERNAVWHPSGGFSAKIFLPLATGYRFDGNPTTWPGLAGNTNIVANLGLINPADYTDPEAFKVLAATLGELAENRYDYYHQHRGAAVNHIGVYQLLAAVNPGLLRAIIQEGLYVGDRA